MQDKINRFQKRLQVKESLEKSTNLYIAPKNNLIQEFLNSEVYHSRLQSYEAEMDARFLANPDIEFSKEEVEELLRTFRSEFDVQKMDRLIQSCKDTVLDVLIKPFGLSAAFFKDQDGGNVTTINNAKQGVYSREQDKYDGGKYSYQNAATNYRDKMRNGDGTFTDRYTGNTLLEHEVNVDHIHSRKSFHDNGGFMLSNDDKKAFARDERNFAITDGSLNKSKSDQSLKEFKERQIKGQETNNKDRFGLDDRRANPAERNADKAFQEHLPTQKEKVNYYAENITKTGFAEAKKMGAQQAIGVLLHELISSIFDEAKDIFKNGFKGDRVNESFFTIVNERFTRIGQRVLSKWKDALQAFVSGSISGFFSNLIATIINMFTKTCARGFRIIREGFFSLIRAIKMMLFPPKGMTLAQAAHEATKMIAASITLAGGILLEEVVEKLIAQVPFLVPVANIISTVITGVVTGLATIFVIYMIDKIDIFGVNAAERHEYVNGQLDKMLQESFADADEIFKEMNLTI